MLFNFTYKIKKVENDYVRGFSMINEKYKWNA